MGLEEDRRKLLDSLRLEIKDGRVLEAIGRVRREEFVSASLRHLAYEDAPVPIGYRQTVSQPLIVAMMTEALEPQGMDTVLEVGTGSGYQAALLSLLVRKVITVERVPALADAARTLLHSLGYTNVVVLPVGEALGCPERGPFNGILVTAGAPRLPRSLLEQLAMFGRLVIPVGPRYRQELLQVRRTQDGHSVRSLGACQFVPLIGPEAWEEEIETP